MVCSPTLHLPLSAGTDNVNQNALVGYFMIFPLYEPIMKVLIAPVDVPGGGTHSASGGAATALAHGPAGFGNDEPGGETVTLDDFLGTNGGSGGGGGGGNGGGGGSGGGGSGGGSTGGVGDGGDGEGGAAASAKKPPPPRRGGGAALGTTEERERLREEAAYLLALMLSWRESTNVYAQQLAAADGVELSVILRAASALFSTPESHRGGGGGGGGDNGGSGGGGGGGGLLGGFFGGSLPPPPDNLLDSLMSWLKYGAVAQPEGDEEGEGDATHTGGGGGGGWDGGGGEVGGGGGGGGECPWELLPGPCVGLLLLHGLMAHSNLLHMPAAWLKLTPKPNEMLHGGAVQVAESSLPIA
jgi:hypothetical protein